ncbi:ABC transporter substrate-binding protein [Fodinicurvata sp. EGI_FJ10296]|uniref:ABC transporter substrate-binding protein n=1 Tax=Fodinicurvata sp. EGI_FJ10296 TaxID=3231908 RepID=UPI00345609FF
MSQDVSRSTRLKSGVASAVLTGAIVVGAMSAAPAAAQESVGLGALFPMTGDLSAYGQGVQNGAMLAIAEINEQGGLLDGRELSLTVADTQAVAQVGVDAAQNLIQVEGVTGLIGALSSGVTIPVARSVASSEGVPMISPASTSPVLTTLEDNGYLFRTTPSDALQGVVLADLVQEQGQDNIGILYINNDYGEGLAEAFADAFEAEGGTVTQSSAYEPGQASYRGEIASLANEGAESMLLIGYPENGVTILRQALEEAYFDSFIFTDGMKSTEVVEAIGGDFLDGSYGTAPVALADSESSVIFREAYEAEYGELPPQPFIDASYDAVYLMALAIQHAGSTDGEAIRDALPEVANAPGETILPGEWEKALELLAAGEDINYEGAGGPQNFDDAGDVPGSYAFWQIQSGEIVDVEVITPDLN